MIIWLLTHALHVAHGPWGDVLWIQPPHISAGIAATDHHLDAWFEFKSSAIGHEHVSWWHIF